ncbi:MAG: hypothetical protein ACFFA3_01195 [Promethearchaeota archaeon]
MDCYDEILEIYQKNNKKDRFITYLTYLINKKSKVLTELQFQNCLILILAIWNPKFIDLYVREGEDAKSLQQEKKEKFIKILKSEFKDFNN